MGKQTTQCEANRFNDSDAGSCGTLGYTIQPRSLTLPSFKLNNETYSLLLSFLTHLSIAGVGCTMHIIVSYLNTTCYNTFTVHVLFNTLAMLKTSIH